MESDGLFIKTNDDNTDITDELFNENYKNYTDPFDIQFFKNEKVINEIKETFLDFYNTVPYIQRCVDKNKPRAKDLPRDNKGRIIVDITRPHHLEDMDYFRPTAICFEKHGVLTLLKPNGNPNSPYGKWIAEEARRCREGYVRESDGEWIPGDLYFFWNYCPIMVIEEDEEEGMSTRYRRFPGLWEGHYLKAHYIWQARHNNKNSAELASRSKGKTSIGAAMLCRRILLGETTKNYKDVTAVAMASDKKFLTGGDVLLDKFQDNLDFCAEYTEFPRSRIKDTENDLKWEIGYKQNNGPKGGIQNVVFGITTGNTPKKGRGSRASLYILEEFGSWANLKAVYNGLRPSVKDGKKAFGLIHLQGCVCAGTRVITANDQLSSVRKFEVIENVKKGDKLLGYNGSGLSIEDITWLQPEAYKKCLKITCSDGTFIECSEDHPLLAKNGTQACFYKANELSVGNELFKFSFSNDEEYEFQLRDNGKGKYFIDKKLSCLHYVNIISIDDIGFQRIYNLTANTTHTYLTNGFISSNTAGDNESDFSSAQDLVRNPDGNDIYALDNVYDKVTQGKKRFPYFFPAYINLQGHYDNNGNSNVVDALLEIISNRIKTKYSNDNPDTLVRLMAEYPIIPEEAMLRVSGNTFPVTQLNERIGEIEGNPNFYDNTFVGKLVMESSGKVKFESTTDTPIRFFPHNDNKLKGALEIYEMPQIDPNTGKVFANRYISSLDPVDRDSADTVSLSSNFVMDLWTDRIVAEWTGRSQFAEDNYENARLLCMFYNCKLLYENNIAGLYGYFQKMNCLYLLEETPPYLKEKELVKTLGFGNTAYGVRTTVPIINHGERLIESWLLAPVKTTDANGNQITLCNINFIKNLALLKELVMYNRMNNFDRVMSLVMLMIFREAKMIMYHGNIKEENRPKGSNAANDKFFSQYDRKFKHS